MCGIVCVEHEGWPAERWRGVLSAMTSRLAHRGPDDEGLWYDEQAGIGLGHRRLSVLDPSPRGHQPMASRDGRFQLVHNGEIYNFRELRDELAGTGHSFATETDTEVMLAAFLQWGIEGALTRFNGMFAFALWDARERRLHLARDRMGEKPLYYGRIGNGLAVASELKAIAAHPEFVAEVDRAHLALYLRNQNVPAPASIYRNVAKVRPAELVTFTLGRGAPQPVRTLYWSLLETAVEGIENPLTLEDAEAVEMVEAEISRAVALRMVSDVPLGAFLSGGIDSSLVASLMQAQSTRSVKTFTIGFEMEGYDEAPYARSVARHLGTAHHELYVTAEEACAVIPRLPLLYDEPFADSSQIPTYLVSKLAREQVKVSLSGDGGDECFGGYKRYRLTRSLWRRISFLPRRSRRAMAALIQSVPPRYLDRGLGWMGPWMAGYGRRGSVGDKLHKLADTLRFASPLQLYDHLLTHWDDPWSLVHGAGEAAPGLGQTAGIERIHDLTDQMMFLDMMRYLPDDILVKLDRAGMGVSLETRVPLLDHSLVELAWRLPRNTKVRNGTGKWLLRQILARHVPPALFERPKMGFGVPLAEWLRGPLREWAEDLLAEARLEREGYLDPQPIRRVWQEHLSGRRNWQDWLWSVLMFEAWLDAQPSGGASPQSGC